VRIIIRGFADGCLLFAESLTVREAELEHSAAACFEAHRWRLYQRRNVDDV
jgi:hypothetical protein